MELSKSDIFDACELNKKERLMYASVSVFGKYFYTSEIKNNLMNDLMQLIECTNYEALTNYQIHF